MTRKVWDGEKPNGLRGLDFDSAVDLLLALNVAKSLADLSPLKAWACTNSRAAAKASGP